MNNLAKFICSFISVMYNLAKFICNLVTSSSAVGFGSALIRWAEHPRLKNANKDSGSGSDTYLYRFGHMSRIQIRHKNSEYATLTQTIRYRTIIRWNKRLYSRVIYKKNTWVRSEIEELCRVFLTPGSSSSTNLKKNWTWYVNSMKAKITFLKNYAVWLFFHFILSTIVLFKEGFLYNL